MAIHFHTRVTLPRQAILLPATAPLRERTESSFSLPLKVRCSPRRAQCAGSSKLVESESQSINTPAKCDERELQLLFTSLNIPRQPPCRKSIYVDEFSVQSIKTPAKCDERELPSLFASMNIPGLPLCRKSIYVDEFSALVTKRWPYRWLQPYYLLCNSFSSFAHPSAVSSDHLAAISSIYVVAVVHDDIFFDLKHDGVLREKSGLDRNILGNPDMIKGYLDGLCDLLLQKEPPQSMTSIQEITWQVGCEFRRLSNQDGFDKLIADALKDYYDSSIESHRADVEGDDKYVVDLEAYTKMRMRNAAGILSSLLVELGNSTFLPAEIRQHPVVQQLVLCGAIHIGYVNDIFSYCKEQDEPHNSRNLIKVLMASEGMELAEAAWEAVNLTNSVFGKFMELEKQLPVWEDETEALIVQRYVEGLKDLISGNLHFYTVDRRYRHPKAVFSELRDLDADLDALVGN